MTVGYKGDAAAEIRSGRPEAYFDYIDRTYGAAFRGGTLDGIETFVLLYQQISELENKESTDRFSERFAPMLPLNARRRIVNDHLHKPQKPTNPSS